MSMSSTQSSHMTPFATGSALQRLQRGGYRNYIDKRKLQYYYKTQTKCYHIILVYLFDNENIVKKKSTLTRLVTYCNPSSVSISIVAALEIRLFV